MQTIIEQNRQRDYERYEAHRRFEEATDIAERIGYPIDHTVHYEMRNGLAYGTFDTKDRPFRAQTEQAMREGREKFTGVNKFEAVRREHEHDEALMMDAFGRGELDGTVLVKISPVPDAVRNGTADINGYRRDLLRSFVRVYYREGDGVACRLFSLDQSDRVGMAAVGDLLGITIDERSSEDILADHALINIDNVSHESIGELVSQAVSIYDRALEMQTGRNFQAGSRVSSKEDALSLVMKNSSLLDEHMRAISDIMGRALDRETKEALLNDRRKRTSAAVDMAVQGIDVSSSNDTAVTEQMAAKDYDGECATGRTMTEAMAMARGKEKKAEKIEKIGRHFDECMNCPNCKSGKGVWVEVWMHKGKKRTDYTCNNSGCGATTLPKRRAEIKDRSNEKGADTISNSKAPSDDKLLAMVYGEYARVRTDVSVGGADRVVYDSRTGEIISKL